MAILLIFSRPNFINLSAEQKSNLLLVFASIVNLLLDPFGTHDHFYPRPIVYFEMGFLFDERRGLTATVGYLRLTHLRHTTVYKFLT
jgi:hypothetical protein